MPNDLVIKRKGYIGISYKIANCIPELRTENILHTLQVRLKTIDYNDTKRHLKSKNKRTRRFSLGFQYYCISISSDLQRAGFNSVSNHHS
jgi:hypothetical protein